MGARRIGIAASVAVAIAACGGNASSGRFSIVPHSATTTAGGSPVRLRASAQVGDVTQTTWTLTGPGSLSVPQGSATDYRPPDIVENDTHATVAAQLGQDTDFASITIQADQTPPGVQPSPVSSGGD